MVRRARKGGSRPDGPGAAPIARPRRWRRSSALREVIAEQDTELRRLVYPLFVSAGGALRGPEGLPALARRNVEGTVREAEDAFRRGVRSVLLFGIPARKDAQGTSAFDPKGPVPSAIRALKTRLPDLVVMADVCLCEYTSHGHCGVLSDGAVDNDRTLPLLGQAAVAYAGAGADVVAPSSMMDHQVAALRRALHDAGQEDTLVLAYAAKFASSLYAPFREAAGSAPSFGDRRSYQMDPRNSREALRELRLDAEEGADALMVKPALPCLDLLARAREEHDLPLAAYQVSGEYAMIKATASQGWCDEGAAVHESLTAIRRAGADLIVTYFAGDLARRVGRGVR